MYFQYFTASILWHFSALKGSVVTDIPAFVHWLFYSTEYTELEPGRLIIDISKRIANEDNLWKLGGVLKLSFDTIQAARTNNPRDIQNAAFIVLKTWLSRPENAEKAYASLTAALQKTDFNWLLESDVSGLSFFSLLYMIYCSFLDQIGATKGW